MKKIIPLILSMVALAGCSEEHDYHWGGPVIPLTLTGIEAVNVDNEGEFPVVAPTAVKKEAYMIGVKWESAHRPSDDYITGPSYGNYYSGYGYNKTVVCLTQFNDQFPAGSKMGRYFKEVAPYSLPKEVDEGFVLLEIVPDPGVHKFRVEYYDYEGNLEFSSETPEITLF